MHPGCRQIYEHPRHQIRVLNIWYDEIIKLYIVVNVYIPSTIYTNILDKVVGILNLLT